MRMLFLSSPKCGIINSDSEHISWKGNFAPMHLSRILPSLKNRAARLKKEILVLYYAYRDPRTPRLTRFIALCVIAYAFSPLDLIPDFIPILGYLDDLILIPLGISLALKMIPQPVLQDCRQQVEFEQSAPRQQKTFLPNSKHTGVAGTLIVILWLLIAAGIVAGILTLAS